MGSLTVTYIRGKFLLGAKRIPIEIDNVSYGNIDGGESRTFNLPDGKHLIVFKYMHVTLRVKLLLSGDDSFTVSWDRTMGGMRITKEFEGETFFDRSGWKSFAFCFAIVLASSVLVTLGNEGMISRTFVLSGILILLTFIFIMIIYTMRKMSRTVTWGGDGE